MNHLTNIIAFSSQFLVSKLSDKSLFIRNCQNQMSESNYIFDKQVLQSRKTQFPIHPILQSRWSSREMTGEQLTDQELHTLFEAGRWAPSHYNLQPWRFVYAKKDSKYFSSFLSLLWPLNQKWCSNASVLVIVISCKYSKKDGKTTLIPTNSYDAGSAWMSIALEGCARGLVVHGLGGFDYDNAVKVAKINTETHKVEAMFAVGKRPEKSVQKMKESITQRMPIEKFIFEGEFADKEN